MNYLYWRAHRTGHFLHQPGGDDSAARLDQEVPKNPQTGNRFSSQAQEGTRKI